MKAPIYNFEQLKRSKEVLLSNKYYQPSFNGFLLNVLKSFSSGIITKEQKELILK